MTQRDLFYWTGLRKIRLRQIAWLKKILVKHAQSELHKFKRIRLQRKLKMLEERIPYYDEQIERLNWQEFAKKLQTVPSSSG